nr:NAD(P)/FAD-dependent oxidoreductase [uncultured Bacillus sp.]
MKEDQIIYDITIIGGGPIGLFTAFYAGMRQATVKIIESLPQVGGQLSTLYPEKYIYDVAGFPKVRARELIDNLNVQLSNIKPVITLNQTVEKVVKQGDGIFKLTTNKEVHYSKTIIIAAGNGAFQPRKLELENSAHLEEKNLYYFIHHVNQFAGQRVAVFGGGDSAVDWALMLEPIVDKVTIIHRRHKFRAHEHSVRNLEISNVDIKTPFIPTKLISNSNGITQVRISHVKTKEVESLDVDAVIVNYGFVSSIGPLKRWGLEIKKHSIVVNSKMETSIEGIYACGDICTYDGKVKLIACGFGEAPIAVAQAKQYIDPAAKKHVPHSSDLFH